MVNDYSQGHAQGNLARWLIADSETLHVDTQPRARGFMTKWIQGHLHVDTQPRGCGHTAIAQERIYVGVPDRRGFGLLNVACI